MCVECNMNWTTRESPGQADASIAVSIPDISLEPQVSWFGGHG